MKWLRRMDVYVGYDLSEYTRIREALLSEGIEIESKSRTRYGRWIGVSKRSFQRNPDSYVKNKSYDTQYIIYVDEDDLEVAKYICNKAMHGR